MIAVGADVIHAQVPFAGTCPTQKVVTPFDASLVRDSLLLGLMHINAF